MRKVSFYGDHFVRFYSQLPNGDQQKIEWVLRLVEELERIPATFLKYLSAPGIYEIRVIHQSRHFRICCFFDTDQQLVLVNAFIKRDRKAPKKEIQKAIRLYKDYYHEKEKRDDP